MRAGCVQLRRRVHSPRIGVLRRLSYSVKLHRVFWRGRSTIVVFIFSFFWVSFGMNILFSIKKRKDLPFFVFFVFFFRFLFLVWTGPNQSTASTLGCRSRFQAFQRLLGAFARYNSTTTPVCNRVYNARGAEEGVRLFQAAEIGLHDPCVASNPQLGCFSDK